MLNLTNKKNYNKKFSSRKSDDFNKDTKKDNGSQYEFFMHQFHYKTCVDTHRVDTSLAF